MLSNVPKGRKENNVKDTLILKDGSVIELEAGASLSAIQAVSEDKAAMVTTWDRFTADNLAQVQIKNGNGLTVGNYTDLVLISETSAIQTDGTILTTYSLREKSAAELLEERVSAIEEGQMVQDGAIADLGDVTSVLAERAEGGTE